MTLAESCSQTLVAEMMNRQLDEIFLGPRGVTPPCPSGYSSPVSGTLFPVCAHRAMRLEVTNAPLPWASCTTEDEFCTFQSTEFCHSKRQSQNFRAWRQPWQPSVFSSRSLTLLFLYLQTHKGMAFGW